MAARPAPSVDDVLEQLQQEIAAWCISWPDPLALDIAAAYDELAHLDAKEQSMLAAIIQIEDVDKPFRMCAVFTRTATPQFLQRQRIISGFAPRRQLLRSRALELSRDRLRPLTLTGLPVEVLRLVFREFEDKDWQDHGPGWEPHVRWSDISRSQTRRQALGNLRLVCRLFADLVAPMLCPVLSVHISQASLDRANIISRNPAIAAGVKGIRVYLDRRPREYAESIARFQKMHLAAVETMETSLADELSPYESGFHPINCGEASPAQIQRYGGLEKGVEACCEIGNDWSKYMASAPDGEPESEQVPLTEYQRALRKGHAEFRRMSDQQHRLLQDGAFANALAKAVARMPNARAVGFFEFYDKPPEEELEHALMTADYEALSQLLARSLEWRQIVAEGDGAIVATEECTLAWELPIALHKAGVSLAQVDLSFCLEYRSFSALNPPDDPAGAAWDDLAAACQDLESFVMSGTVLAPKSPRIKIPDIFSFVGAAVSRCGPRLRCLGIGFLNRASLGYCTGYYHTGPLLRTLPALPRVRELSLDSLALPHAALDAFCSGLGPDLADLYMSDVLLHGGGLADILDTLRGKMARAGSRGAVECLFSGLLGGEFEFLAVVEPAVFGDPEVEGCEVDPGATTRELMEAVAEYVQGSSDENPLRRGGG